MTKKIVPIVIIAAMFLTMLPSCSFAAETNFSDISGHWAEATIEKWKDQGIIAGYPDGTFKPDNYVTRAELSKIITLAFDLKKDEQSDLDNSNCEELQKLAWKYPYKNDVFTKYIDLDSFAWYYPYVECAAQYIPVYPLPEEYKTNLPYQKNSEKGGYGFLPDVDALRIHLAETLVKIKIEKENLNIQIPVFSEVFDAVNESFKDSEYDNTFAMVEGIPGNVQRMFEYTWLAKELDLMQGDTNGEFLPYNNVSRAEVLIVIDRMLAK